MNKKITKNLTDCKNKNHFYSVDIMDMNTLGNGVARIDVIVVFVKNVVSGDSA